MTVATNIPPNANDHNHSTPPYHTHPVPLLEIARLENSLQHLRRTQDELRSYSDDPELSQYLRENEAVMFVCPLSLPLFFF
jgi:hypothetical protein